MTAYDACFLAVACAALGERSRRYWLIALVPLVAYGIALAPLGDLCVPIAALAACALAQRPAAAALLLVVPAYPTLTHALVTGVTWLVAVALFDEVALGRLTTTAIPPAFRGAPVRLLALGVLYFVLYPVATL